MKRALSLTAAALIAAAAQADAGYHGPIIDAHAHIRFTDD